MKPSQVEFEVAQIYRIKRKSIEPDDQFITRMLDEINAREDPGDELWDQLSKDVQTWINDCNELKHSKGEVLAFPVPNAPESEPPTEDAAESPDEQENEDMGSKKNSPAKKKSGKAKAKSKPKKVAAKPAPKKKVVAKKSKPKKVTMKAKAKPPAAPKELTERRKPVKSTGGTWNGRGTDSRDRGIARAVIDVVLEEPTLSATQIYDKLVDQGYTVSPSSVTGLAAKFRQFAAILVEKGLLQRAA